MWNFDFTPLFRSTIGFDRMLDLLDQAVEPGYPPYNIEKTGEDSYRLTMAVAGFKAEELAIVAEGVALTVTGERCRMAATISSIGGSLNAALSGASSLPST